MNIMERVIPAILSVHVVAGIAALLIAPCAMVTVKGGKAHRLWGKIYFVGMAIVATTALILALWRPIPFLALVAIFSFYSAFRGYRVLKLKKEAAGFLDWCAALVLAAVGGALILMAVTKFQAGKMPSPIVALAFGALGLRGAVSDIQTFRAPSSDKNSWWFDHMGGMLVSYIGAVTAFSAVNIRFLPTVWVWLWPTALGVPGIYLWQRYYRRKFGIGVQNQPSSNLV